MTIISFEFIAKLKKMKKNLEKKIDLLPKFPVFSSSSGLKNFRTNLRCLKNYILMVLHSAREGRRREANFLSPMGFRSVTCGSHFLYNSIYRVTFHIKSIETPTFMWTVARTLEDTSPSVFDIQ